MNKLVSIPVVIGFALQACHSHVPEPLSSEEVMAQLNFAYALTDRGQLTKSDSIYKYLLAHQVNSEDSFAISSSYIQVLLGLDDYQGALMYVDRAFPSGRLEPWDQLRRHSFRQQAFLGLNDCDGIKAEQAALLALVEQHEGLQLSLEDIVANGKVVSERFP